jgi:hypothetical protein
MGDVSLFVFSDHNPTNNGSSPTIEPNIPILHYSSISGHLYVAQPNDSDLAEKTRFLMLNKHINYS